MTEQEWLACNDPQTMLEFLQGKVSDRKLWLFAVACCSRAVRRGAEAADTFRLTAEKWADGQADGVTLRQALDAAQVPFLLSFSMTDGTPTQVADWAVRDAIGIAYHAGLSPEVVQLHKMMDGCLPDFDQPRCHVAAQRERQAQAAHLRDLFGPVPFRAVALNPAWLVWQDGTIPKLAQAIYNDRAFGLLPVLADALEDAGCTDADILAHCRGPGLHARGCWVLDTLLDRR